MATRCSLDYFNRLMAFETHHISLKSMMKAAVYTLLDCFLTVPLKVKPPQSSFPKVSKHFSMRPRRLETHGPKVKISSISI